MVSTQEGGFHVTSSLPCWSVASIVRPPEVVYFCIVIDVSIKICIYIALKWRLIKLLSLKWTSIGAVIWPHLNEQYRLSNFLKLVIGTFFFAARNKNSFVSGPRINHDMDEDLSRKKSELNHRTDLKFK